LDIVLFHNSIPMQIQNGILSVYLAIIYEFMNLLFPFQLYVFLSEFLMHLDIEIWFLFRNRDAFLAV
jgi:hypothetical protein